MTKGMPLMQPSEAEVTALAFAIWTSYWPDRSRAWIRDTWRKDMEKREACVCVARAAFAHLAEHYQLGRKEA